MKIIFISFLILVPLFVFAQVGINTTNPQAALDIQSSGMDSILTLRDSTGTAVFNINNNGRIYTKGTEESVTQFDIRSNHDGDIIAIGNTNLSYTEAGEGVLKYNPDTKSVFLSVDTGWLELSKRPLRVSVSLEPTENSFVLSGDSTFIKEWSIISDPYGATNSLTGQFIAPHNGIYGVYLNIVFNQATLPPGSYIRTDFKASSGRTSANLNTYPVSTKGYPIIQTTNYFKLNKGDILTAQIYQNTGVTLEILHPYSYLSIVEL